MRWKELFLSMVLRQDDLCMSPRTFDGIGAGACVGIFECDGMIDSKVIISLIAQDVVWLPTLGDDCCARKNPLFDNWKKCFSVPKILIIRYSSIN
jgi:hypothetical protein